MRRARLALTLVLSGVSSAGGLAGCQTHDCDASTIDAGGGTVTQTDGGLLVWQSAPQGGPWLDFPGEATVNFTYPKGFRSPFDWSVFVSTEPYEGQGQGTFTPVSGQLAEFTNEDAGSISITNASCAEYYLYVVGYAFAGSPPRDSGASDAPVDARPDARDAGALE